MSNTIFNKSIVWKSKFDTEDMLYLIGITQTKYTLATLEDSNDTDYASDTAYYLVSQDAGSKNRRINLLYQVFYFYICTLNKWRGSSVG